MRRKVQTDETSRSGGGESKHCCAATYLSKEAGIPGLMLQSRPERSTSPSTRKAAPGFAGVLTGASVRFTITEQQFEALSSPLLEIKLIFDNNCNEQHNNTSGLCSRKTVSSDQLSWLRFAASSKPTDQATSKLEIKIKSLLPQGFGTL